ncbi:MAG: 23S rRNA (uracil(1939)-C(5))-methyltransferase RlmD [Candidatus Accumulibacter sp.]|nr:23S rRNA (uracil(1939)-C(5))-methyltransferase RlmD [Accumulibacter sp.]
MPIGVIESLDHEGRGITRLDGKTVFVEGALPGERVEFQSFRQKPSYEIAHLLTLLDPSPDRVSPRCPHYGVCGGCSMQHFDPLAQVAAKQRLLEANLWHLARLKPDVLYAPIHGEPWRYRHRARLSVRFVPGKGGVLIGFHEKKSSYIADMQQCEILPPGLSALLPPLHELVDGLSIRDRLPQIEMAVGARSTALVLRILAPINAGDRRRIREFVERHGVVIYLQPQGPASVSRLHPQTAPPLTYRLPEFAIEYAFSPTEFTQVNPSINELLVRRAIHLLDPQPGERIADMFCGVGNFTLPLARSGARVLGIEGNAQLVERAMDNAAAHDLADRVDFLVTDLFTTTASRLAALGNFDKMLVDPPREGAVELIKALDHQAPERLLYVSCNPATLARDAGLLVRQKGYQLRGAGVVNMFPHTSHVESIALFKRDAP